MDKEVKESPVPTPKKWLGPDPMSEKGVDTLREIIKLSTEQGFLSQADADKGMKILAVNPHRRLSRLGMKLSRVEALVKELAKFERSVEVMTELLIEEHKQVAGLIGWQPEWQEGEPEEEGDR